MRSRLTSALIAVAVVAASCSAASPASVTAPPLDVTTLAGSTTTRVVPAATAPADPHGLENLSAFARLVNYVRFFHPSDEAADADWAEFLVVSLGRVELANGADRLATVLQEQIQSVAPSVVVFPTGDLPRVQGMTIPDSATDVTAWVHRGVDTADVVRGGTPYASERIVVPVEADRPEWFADPGEPLTVDLGGGVSASIPLAVYIADGATIPASLTPDADWLHSEPPLLTYGDYPKGDRTTRQAAVILAWGFYQHFYPYWDVVDADWDAALSDALTMANERPDVDLVTVLRWLVARAQDGHATVSGGSEDLATPPIRWAWIEEGIVVTDVRSSAQDAFTPGSVVLIVDGVPAAQAIKAAEAFAAGATPQHRRRVALISILEGPWGSTLDLTVQTSDGTYTEVSLKREGVRVWRGTDEQRPNPIALVAPEIAYLDLTRVSRLDLINSLATIEAVDQLIVDMRGHPSDQAFNLFPRLLAEPTSTDRLLLPITTRPDGTDRAFENVTWTMEPIGPRLATEIVFLIDERAISATETLMGMVEAHNIGEIVGSPTAGTNGNVISFIVPGGIQIKMTGLKVTNADGSPHHGVGVQPTLPVGRTAEGISAGHDELLDAAIELLSE